MRVRPVQRASTCAEPVASTTTSKPDGASRASAANPGSGSVRLSSTVSSTPNARASSSLCGDGAATVIRAAPPCSSSWLSSSPVGPAPSTSTSLPGRSARTSAPCIAHASGSVITATIGSSPSRAKHLSAPTATSSANPPGPVTPRLSKLRQYSGWSRRQYSQ